PLPIPPAVSFGPCIALPKLSIGNASYSVAIYERISDSSLNTFSSLIMLRGLVSRKSWQEVASTTSHQPVNKRIIFVFILFAINQFIPRSNLEVHTQVIRFCIGIDEILKPFGIHIFQTRPSNQVEPARYHP